MCTSCCGLPKLHAFRMRVYRTKVNPLKEHSQKGGKKNTEKCNNKFLNRKSLQAKLTHYRQTSKRQRLINLRLRIDVARLRMRRLKVRDKVAEHARRGDIPGLTASLHKAYDKGNLATSSNTLKFMKTIADNMRKESKGHRQDHFTEKFYEVLRIWGGKRLSNFVANNLLGPSESAQKRTRRKNLHKHRQEGLNSSAFSRLANIYRDLKQKHGIIGPVLSEAAEDETVITKHIYWDQATDELWGFCGPNESDHVCSSDYTVKVGTGEDGYHNIEEAFANNKIASYARVIMINPLHKDLPALVALLMPTCNTFNHEWVDDQWKELEKLYDKHLLPVLGPLVGHASDGDARRRKCMITRAAQPAIEFDENRARSATQ